MGKIYIYIEREWEKNRQWKKNIEIVNNIIKIVGKDIQAVEKNRLWKEYIVEKQF